MARVTSKLQVTIPKAIAEEYGIAPGDDIEWIPAGAAVRVRKLDAGHEARDAGAIARRLALFDAATERQRQRQRGQLPKPLSERGWQRDDLYDRGIAR